MVVQAFSLVYNTFGGEDVLVRRQSKSPLSKHTMKFTNRMKCKDAPVRRPSHSVMNSVFTRTTWSCSKTLRVLMKQSISSMKIIDGASLLAKLRVNYSSGMYKGLVGWDKRPLLAQS